MKRSIILLVSLVCVLPALACSQMASEKPVFIDIAFLEKLRQLDAASNPQLQAFLAASTALLDMKPLSVMDKKVTPPSGDKHDFMSMGPYWWPNPDKPDGLPYIRKDGERNPEYHAITDESYWTRTICAAESLAAAFYLTKEDKYAEKAAQLLRVWFLDEKTRMNPNMQHAQFIPGINTGRGIGLIETRNIFKVTDAIVLLRKSTAWKSEDDVKIKQWFAAYFTWITTHPYGIDESGEKNNHGTWYDVQACAIAFFLGKDAYAKNVLEEAKHTRIDVQIDAEGKQPLELARTKSWGYSQMNLSAFMHLAVLGEKVGVDLWHYQSESGGSIRKALDFLLPFTANPDAWPYPQIGSLHTGYLHYFLRMAVEKYDAKIYGEWIKKIYGSTPPPIDIVHGI